MSLKIKVHVIVIKKSEHYANCVGLGIHIMEETAMVGVCVRA